MEISLPHTAALCLLENSMTPPWKFPCPAQWLGHGNFHAQSIIIFHNFHFQFVEKTCSEAIQCSQKKLSLSSVFFFGKENVFCQLEICLLLSTNKMTRNKVNKNRKMTREEMMEVSVQNMVHARSLWKHLEAAEDRRMEVPSPNLILKESKFGLGPFWHPMPLCLSW